ncbi:MAG: cyclic lactone autoinducer peptide [Lachnospiraceae bacterium]|nr:cyclic lactone autoinducer peptide [Lachnospiraceae bacterium]
MAQKIGEKDIIRNTSYWPPYCMGFVHQPKMPKSKNSD